jgi:lantibiotic biosynthesis protein
VADAAALAREVARGAPGQELDLIGGAAGTALALLELADLLDERNLVVGATSCADALVAAAEPQVWGSAWSGADGPPLLGLGHGAAGIAIALAEVAARTGRETYDAVARRGLEYERGWYDPAEVGWPDLRGDGDGSLQAWCHGALGIGLSRLRMLPMDPLASAEASAALQAARDVVIRAGTALQGGAVTDCTACHGLAGAVELLLAAAEVLQVEDHAEAARRVAALMLEQRRTAGGWPCGLPGAGVVPGLMTGTAGIALTLLRAAGQVRLDSPLLPGPRRPGAQKPVWSASGSA